MATRARFGIRNVNGTITSVYHHWDGYPDWLLVKLRADYNTEDKIREVMKDGDMSCIAAARDWNHNEIPKRPLYYKERGENCPPVTNSQYSFWELCHDCGAEFAYVFENGEWSQFSL